MVSDVERSHGMGLYDREGQTASRGAGGSAIVQASHQCEGRKLHAPAPGAVRHSEEGRSNAERATLGRVRTQG